MSSEGLTIGVLCAILLALLLGGGHYGNYYPRARQQWLLLGCGALAALALPNWWLMLGVLWFLGHVLARQAIGGFLAYAALISQTTVVVGAIALAGQALTPADAPVLLWTIASLSIPLAIWTGISQYRHPYNYRLTWGPFCLFEEGAPDYYAGYEPPIVAGQGNFNHTEAVAGVLGACALGLTGTTMWAWGLVLCAISPILVGRWNRRHYDDAFHARTNMPWLHQATQGDIYLLVLLWLWVWSVLPVEAGLLAIALALVLPFYYWKEGAERVTMWGRILSEQWWPRGWAARLLGCGPRSWAQGHAEYARARPSEAGDILIWTTAHSEYVQVLYEYGALGLVLLIGTLASLLLANTTPAIWNMGLMLCVVAALQYPWTLYHELRVIKDIPIIQASNPLTMRQEQTNIHGSPLLNVLSGLWAVLAMLG